MIKKPIAVLLFTGLSLFVGCSGSESDSPDLGQVTGTVTIDGKPTENVVVTFTPTGDGGRASSGTTNSSGEYELAYSADETGAVIGSHTVTIAGKIVATVEVPEEYDPSFDPKASNPVPEGYETMEKQVQVEEGSNTIDLAYPLSE